MNINFVSVVVPVYNSEKFITSTINSVLKQTYKDFELIVINDASTDRTLDLIQKNAEIDKRIKIINLKKNIGSSNARNEAINQATGEWIAVMDSDDVMYKNCLEEQINYLNNNEDIKVLSCLGTYLGVKGKTFGVTTTRIKDHDTYKNLIEKNKPIGILHSGTVFNKKKFLDLGGYREKFTPCYDIDLWNRFALAGCKIFVLKKILMQYRIHRESKITSKFIESQKKYAWVKYCLLCKNKNRPEIDFEDFLNLQKSENFLIKLNRLRKMYYRFFFRQQILYFLEKKFIKLFLSMLFSLVLGPITFVTTLMKRIFYKL